MPKGISLKPRKRKLPIDRFLSKVDKTTNCWIWLASQRAGYGSFVGVDCKSRGAHQFSYSHYIGEIPKGMCVCHKCDNKLCVNPEHLFLGTQKDNLHDMHKKGRNRATNTYSSGPNHCNARLSGEQVIHIRDMYSTKDYSWAQLGRLFNVSKKTIGNVLQGRTYTNV